jgi:hypothetical protein
MFVFWLKMFLNNRLPDNKDKKKALRLDLNIWER